MESMSRGFLLSTDDPNHQVCTMSQRNRILMWSQRDLETSIQSLCEDISTTAGDDQSHIWIDEHIEFVELSGNIDMHEIKKDAAHIRYELMSIAKKIELKIQQKT